MALASRHSVSANGLMRTDLLGIFLALAVSACPSPTDKHGLSRTKVAEPAVQRTLTFQGDETQLNTLSPRWRLAAASDPMDLQALAEEEGAARLVAVASNGGVVGRTALMALPWAPDARAEGSQLCALLEAVRIQEQELVLRVVHQFLTQPQAVDEPLDPNTEQSCRRQLAQVLEQEEAGAGVKDWATSALEALSL